MVDRFLSSCPRLDSGPRCRRDNGEHGGSGSLSGAGSAAEEMRGDVRSAWRASMYPGLIEKLH